jgi:hypothetical protein
LYEKKVPKMVQRGRAKLIRKSSMFAIFQRNLAI